MISRRRLLLQGIAAAGFSGAAPLSARAADTEPPRVEVFTLSSGARFVSVFEPGAPLVAFEALFATGAGDESPAEAGITALLARSWLSSTEDRSNALLAYDVAALGGSIGAWSTDDYVELYALCQANSASVEDTARTLLMNFVAAPAFEMPAVAAAKAAQLRAVALAATDPVAHTLAALRRQIWSDAPQGGYPQSTPATIRALTPIHLRRHYARFFQQPTRAVFVVAGNILPTVARRLVESHLNAGGWPERLADAHAVPRSARPGTGARSEGTAPRIASGEPDLNTGLHTSAPVLCVGYVAPSLRQLGPEGTASLLVLDSLLAGGKASRLFALRDRPAAGTPPIGYDVRSVLETGRLCSLWTVYVSGCARPLSEVRAALIGELTALTDGTRPPTEAEIERAKAYLKGKHRRERVRLKERALAAGLAELIGPGATFEAEFDALIDAVTAAAVTQTARTLFGGNPAVAHTAPPVVG